MNFILETRKRMPRSRGRRKYLTYLQMKLYDVQNLLQNNPGRVVLSGRKIRMRRDWLWPGNYQRWVRVPGVHNESVLSTSEAILNSP